MTLRRGFKSQCERRSVEFRRRLGIPPTGALDAIDLADLLNVTVWSSFDIAGVPTEQLYELNNDDSWSALTIRIGPAHLVVYKHVSSSGRRNSVIMHELSHIILGHELADACVLEDGSLVPGNYSQDQEDEADWLAGTLLLPRSTLVAIRRSGLTDETACSEFNVSLDMLKWRMRMTGVDYQFGRASRRRAS